MGCWSLELLAFAVGCSLASDSIETSSTRTEALCDDAPGPLRPRPGPERELSVKSPTSDAALHDNWCFCPLETTGALSQLVLCRTELLVLHGCRPEVWGNPKLLKAGVCERTRSIC